MTSPYLPALQKIIDLQPRLADLHPVLNQLHPVAICENDQVSIFDLDNSGNNYLLAEQCPAPMPIPTGIRAAFPVGSAEKIACVVTGEVFDDLAGYVTIFHEFVHCTQYETCELPLKQQLAVWHKAQAANDFMWEINHPFPYDSRAVAGAYWKYLEIASMLDLDAIAPVRKHLRNTLSLEDQEYMHWQEWKEGFARYIENCIRKRLGLAENHHGAEPPFSRVTFYEGGARLIQAIAAREMHTVADLPALYVRMSS